VWGRMCLCVVRAIYTPHTYVTYLVRFGVASTAVKLVVRLIGITAKSLKKKTILECAHKTPLPR
jgi:hypothetical protein